MALTIRREITEAPRQGRFGLGGHHEQILTAGHGSRLFRFTHVFFQYDMRIGTTHAKCGDSGPLRSTVAFPVQCLRRHIERRLRPIDFRIRFRKVGHGRDDIPGHGQAGLDHTHHAGGGPQMPDIALHRADRTGVVSHFRRLGVDLLHGTNLNGVPK